MVIEKNYLIKTLKESGIKSQVYTNMKKLKQGNEPHVGAVLRNGETFTRSGSKKVYTDQEGRRKRRVKLWNRSTSLHVVIADTSEEKVEEILENFIVNLKKGLEYCEKAAALGADIALFPEMWSNGYAIYDRPAEEWTRDAIPLDGEFMQEFACAGRRLNMAVGVTLLEQYSRLPCMRAGHGARRG